MERHQANEAAKVFIPFALGRKTTASSKGNRGDSVQPTGFLATSPKKPQTSSTSFSKNTGTGSRGTSSQGTSSKLTYLRPPPKEASSKRPSSAYETDSTDPLDTWGAGKGSAGDVTEEEEDDMPDASELLKTRPPSNIVKQPPKVKKSSPSSASTRKIRKLKSMLIESSDEEGSDAHTHLKRTATGSALSSTSPKKKKKPAPETSQRVESPPPEEPEPPKRARPKPKPKPKRELTPPAEPVGKLARQGDVKNDGNETVEIIDMPAIRAPAAFPVHDMPVVEKRVPAAFPVDHDSPQKTKTEVVAPAPSLPPVRTALAFPVEFGSPLKAQTTKAPAPFPIESSPMRTDSSTKRSKNGKAKGSPRYRSTTAELGSDTEGADVSMSMSQASTSSTESLKRESPRSSASRPLKRQKPSEVDDLTSFFHENSLDAPDLDPSKLCPFCDDPLPPYPSRRLTRMIAQVKLQSWPDPREANPLGLGAPLGLYISVCQAHADEVSFIPKGLAHGWPIDINFDAIPERMEKLQDQLWTLVQSPTGPFWDSAKQDVTTKGKGKANSMAGQMETFQDSQPGYYGERGSLVIHTTLLSMMPVSTLPRDAIYPLGPDDFIRRVLVPEAATLLIEEDMGITRPEALLVIKESREYGQAMFHAQEGDSEDSEEEMETKPALSSSRPQRAKPPKATPKNRVEKKVNTSSPKDSILVIRPMRPKTKKPQQQTLFDSFNKQAVKSKLSVKGKGKAKIEADSDIEVIEENETKSAVPTASSSDSSAAPIREEKMQDTKSSKNPLTSKYEVLKESSVSATSSYTPLVPSNLDVSMNDGNDKIDLKDDGEIIEMVTGVAGKKNPASRSTAQPSGATGLPKSDFEVLKEPALQQQPIKLKTPPSSSSKKMDPTDFTWLLE